MSGGGGGGGAVQNQTPDYNTATYYSFKSNIARFKLPHTYNQQSMVYIRIPLVYLKQNQNINNIIRFSLLNL